MAFISPLRYPGGKGKLSNFIKYILLQNGLNDGVYIEPYAGGAGVACDLLVNGYVERIIINDADHAVYAFWNSLISHTDELCSIIEATPVTLDTWYEQKQVQENEDASILELGFSTFFLNRTNRSGILKGGVIGGFSQEGDYLIDARYNTPALIQRIRNIAQYQERIELHNQDALVFLDEINTDLDGRSLIYFDPPYYVKGQGLYKNFYTKDDHKHIAEAIINLDTPWIVSYDNVPEIRNLYPDCLNMTYNISYSAQQHYAGNEIIIFSEHLDIPEIESPLEIKKSHVKKLEKEIQEQANLQTA